MVDEWPHNQFRKFEKALLVLPHPDDELFFSGLIQILQNQNCTLSFLWLSVGGIFPKRRKKEVLSITSIIDVPIENCRIANMNDGMFWSNFRQLIIIIKQAVSDFRPELIITTSLQGGHCDHDATFVACEYIVQNIDEQINLISVPLYYFHNYRFVIGKNEKVYNSHKMEDISIYLGIQLSFYRLRILLHYVSQWSILVPFLLFGGIQFLTYQSFSMIRPNLDASCTFLQKVGYPQFKPFQLIFRFCDSADFKHILSDLNYYDDL